ncbi:hypothetical protein IJ380_03990 [Candidatus Saccharibacteria bacterium]|nr:hypothetical protein [Candidatus Saccharibacteria bacterium]
MGYKTPLVCKEIYLPIAGDDDGKTLTHYKEKYGIDLLSLISLSCDGKDIQIEELPEFTKFYIVDVDGVSGCGRGAILPCTIYPLLSQANRPIAMGFVISDPSSDPVKYFYLYIGFAFSEGTTISADSVELTVNGYNY